MIGKKSQRNIKEYDLITASGGIGGVFVVLNKRAGFMAIAGPTGYPGDALVCEYLGAAGIPSDSNNGGRDAVLDYLGGGNDSLVLDPEVYGNYARFIR